MRPVKQQGLQAAAGTTPFNLLFLGFSMFIIAAAVMLDVPARQRLLQAPDTASRLREELKVLRAETAIIRNLPSLPASDLTRGPTSLN